MKRVAIDFAAPSLARSWYRLGPRGWVVLALGVTLCGAALALGGQMLARQRALEAQLAALRASVIAPAAAAAAASASAQATAAVQIGAAQASAVNGAILQLNLPWPALRDAVGAATPASVALLGLEPDARRRSVKITAETKDAESMIAYVEQLKGQQLFGDVVLLRHEINELDPNRPLRFEVDASWSSPGQNHPAGSAP
jgi:hypothetical protein